MDDLAEMCAIALSAVQLARIARQASHRDNRKMDRPKVRGEKAQKNKLTSTKDCQLVWF